MASRRLRREAIAVSGLGENRAGAARTRGPMPSPWPCNRGRP